MDDNAMERAAFRAALPFYLNGTLGAAERGAVEAHLAAHPDARAELELAQALAGAARRHAEDRAPMAGFDTFKARLAAARAADRPAPAPRWRAWFAGWGMTPALGLVIALLGVQTVINIGGVATPDGIAVTRSLSTSQRPADLKIVVKSTSRLAAVTELLQQQHCQIVWGPGSGGEFWLVVDDRRRLDAVHAALLRSPLVEDALVLEQK